MPVTELWRATKPGGTHTLHVIQREATFQPFVVCHNLTENEIGEREWDWGTYCDTLETAVEIFINKAAVLGWIIPFEGEDAASED